MHVYYIYIYTSTYMYYHMLSYAIIHIYLVGGVNPSEKYERQLG